MFQLEEALHQDVIVAVQLNKIHKIPIKNNNGQCEVFS